MLYLCLPPSEQRDRLVIGYVHHGTGSHADEAEKHVCSLAKNLGVRFISERIAIPADRIGEVGWEAAAREGRYTALDRMAEREGCELILLGHTLDDQAEGMLLYLMRGAGISGLASIRSSYGKYYRPLIRYRHRELIDFLEERGIAYLEDPSNQDQRLTRNRIRHTLRPLIEQQFGAGGWKNIARSAGFFDEFLEILEAETDRAFHSVCKWRRSRWIALDKHLLSEYLQGLKINLLHHAFAYAAGVDFQLFHVPRKVLISLNEFLCAHPGEVKKLAYGVIARLTDNSLIFDGIAYSPEQIWQLPGEITLLDGTVLNARWRDAAEFKGISPDPGKVEYIDSTSVGNQVVVRPWRNGDRFEPLGRPGQQVKITHVLSGSARKKSGPLWVTLTNDRIFYVVGHRIADFCKVQKSTKEVWRITCEQ